MASYVTISSKTLVADDYLLNPDRFVYPFVIKEKNGKERTIITYNKSGNNGAVLRAAHESITHDFSKNFAERNTNSFAYHKNVRCYDALQSHLKSNIFIKLDIHHFFESITEELFFSIYGEYFNNEWRKKLQILFYKGSLSIGFVSSPVISDFFMRKFDKDVSNYLLEHPELHYSRYSDDILLSSELDDDTSLNELFEFVKKELALFKLEINEKKTRRITLDYDKHNSISYLGLNLSKSDYLNNKITISKRYILFLLFLIEKQRGYTDHCYLLDNEIKSRVAYLAYNSPISYQRFQKKHMNKYGEPYMFTPRELDKRSASHVVDEIPNFEEYSKLFKINIHKKVAGKEKQGFAINDAIEIEKYLGTDQEVVEIPYFADSIGEGAFQNACKVKRIILNEKLKSIDINAFRSMPLLEEINLPKSLRFIGDSAFRGCGRLTKINIPEKIKTLQSNAFAECRSLKEITLSEGLQLIMSSAFSGTAIESLHLPDSLKEIQCDAFKGCEQLKEINLASSHVELIDCGAFYNCVLLEEVILPNTLLTLGSNAFSNCSFLKRVYIPASVLEIGSLPFKDCPLLTTIDVDKNNKIYLHREDNAAIVDHNGYLLFTIKDTIDNDIKYIGTGVFANTFIKSIAVPEGVEAIYEEAFSNCPLLKNISLPTSLKSIGGGVFSDCISLEEITLPEGIESIPSSLFSGCINLKNVKMSDDVTSIGDFAFKNCEKLGIKLPKNLKVIGQYSFAGCIGIKDLFIPAKVKQIKRDAFKGINYTLETVKVDPLNITFSSGEDTNTIYNVKKGVLLFGCKGAKIAQGIRTINKFAFAYCTSLKSIEIPNTVQIIGKSAFIGCEGLTKIDLSQVNKIESSAFEKCINLEEVLLPNSLTVIEDKAFVGTKLKKIALPESVSSYGKEIFSHCAFLEEINLPSTFTVQDLNKKIFDSCVSLKHINLNPNNQSFDTSVACDALISKDDELLLGCSNTNIPQKVKKITSSAFYGNRYLEHIEIPSTVEKIDEKAFANCSSLKSVKFLNDINIIPDGIFINCSNLEKVVLPSHLVTIGNHAFSNCSKLKSISLPESLEAIGFVAFRGTGFEEIVLPSNIRVIGSYAFAECHSLMDITLPDSLETLGYHAFEETRIKTIKMPRGVDTIPSFCFFNCHELEKIDLSHIKNVDRYAFSNCVNLKEVTLNDDAIFIWGDQFAGCTNLTKVHLSETLKSIPTNCFKNCTSLKEINFPESLSEINDGAFDGCSLLDVPAFPKDLIKIGRYAFCDNKTIHNLLLPRGLKDFDNGAFYGCDIEHISVDPNNKWYSDMGSDIITYLDLDNHRHLLLGCKNSLIPEGIEIIDRCAFVSVDKLKNFKLPKSLLAIHDYAFDNVDLGIEDFIFPDSLQELGYHAFNISENIKKIKFNSGLKIVGSNHCKGIKSLYIPTSLEHLGYYDFDNDIKFEVNPDNKSYSTIDGNILLINRQIIFTNKDARLPLKGECSAIGNGCYSNREFDVVEIPEGVTVLSGFNNCMINELRLPKSLKTISAFASNTIIKKIVVARGNPYFYVDEKGINLLDATKKILYYCLDGNIPEGVTYFCGSAVFHQDIDRLVIPSTYNGHFYLDTRLYKEVVVAKDNPYFFSKDNAIIRTKDKSVVFMLDPAIIPEGVERISTGVLVPYNEPYSLLSVPKSVKFIDKTAVIEAKKPQAIKVHKDNPIFDSRIDCNAIIVTASNLLVVDSKQTVVPEGVVVAKNVRKNSEIKEKQHSEYMFVSLSFGYGTLVNSSKLPF